MKMGCWVKLVAGRRAPMAALICVVAVGGGQVAANGKTAGEWLKEAKEAIERLQDSVGSQTWEGTPALAANLVSALGQAHRHTVAAARQRRPDSATALREVHAALIELARGEATYRNLLGAGGKEEGEGGAGGIVLAGFAEARDRLSEASFVAHRLTAAIAVPGDKRQATVTVRNGGRRLVKALRITLIGGRDWVVAPAGKWTFTELPAGGERQVVFSLRPPQDRTEGRVKLVARLAFYDFFGRAVVEREQEADLP